MPAFLIYGTFMRGQPGHANLEGAEFLAEVATAPRYRLWEVDGRWPALIEDEDGARMEIEISSVSRPGTASPESPLGRALVGHTEGDTVEISAPGGTWLAQILTVKAP